MINIIICDNEKAITEKVKETIMKIMFKTNLKYKLYIFNRYDEKFYEKVEERLDNKIYILDIEVEDKSGIEVSKEIRENDWESIIIILTAHYELEQLAYKSKILLLDFISKYDLYSERITEAITMCINRKLSNEKLTIKERGKIKQLAYKDILYISCETGNRKIEIVTMTSRHETNESLKEIEQRLKGRFIKSHRACIVNADNIKQIDTKNKKIILKNNEEIDLISRNYMKEVKEYVNS